MSAVCARKDPVKRCSVVVIEDNSADLRWFELMMAEAELPCALKAFLSIPAALKELGASEQHDAIFLTVMPLLLSLEEAYAEIRALPHLAGVPIIALVDGEHEVEFVKRAGLTRWIQKPVTPAALESLLGDDLSTRPELHAKAN